MKHIHPAIPDATEWRPKRGATDPEHYDPEADTLITAEYPEHPEAPRKTMTAAQWLDAVLDCDDDGQELDEAIARVLAGHGPQRIGGQAAPLMELSLTPPVFQQCNLDGLTLTDLIIDSLHQQHPGHTIDLRAEPPQEPSR